MKIHPESTLRLTVLALPAVAYAVLVGRPARGQSVLQNPPPAPAAKDEAHVPVTFIGGFETDRRDNGRPVVLIAAALGVPTEVFRTAFSGVHPAGPDRGPTGDEARRNKAALMRVLAPYGITNDRLDTVSNYYRYNRSRGEWWRYTPASAYATVRNGVVTGFTITNPGSGYSSTPTISLPNLKAKVTVSYSTDFNKNGSITAIGVGGAEPAATR